MSIIVPGQLQRNPLTGKLQRDKTTGKIRRAKNSSQLICCCNTGCPCGPDPASRSGLPDVISVTFSGVTIPSGCLLGAEFNNYIFESEFEGNHSLLVAIRSLAWTYTSLPINQKFCLTRMANTCYWSVDVPCDVTYWYSQNLLGNISGAPICDCGYYGGCLSFHIDTMRVILTVNEFPGIGAVPVLTVGLVIPVVDYPFIGPFNDGSVLFDAVGLDPVQTVPCSSTLSMDNAARWYRTQYLIDIGPGQMHSEWITDPGGACIAGVDVPCPASPGNSFGGSALIDTTGAACP